MNHYEVLAVPRDVSDADLRRAWRAYARQHHPDVCKDPDAGERFNAGATAYEVLADPEQRAAYNRLLLLRDPQAELGQVIGRPLTDNESRGVRLLAFAARLWRMGR